jgi:predicted ABC-type ATPase
VKSPELALDRIRTRVAADGHHVPETDVRRRFVRSQANLPAAIEQSHGVRLYDNTDRNNPHREIAVMTDGKRRAVEDLPGWAQAAIAGTPP